MTDSCPGKHRNGFLPKETLPNTGLHSNKTGWDYLVSPLYSLLLPSLSWDAPEPFILWKTCWQGPQREMCRICSWLRNAELWYWLQKVQFCRRNTWWEGSWIEGCWSFSNKEWEQCFEHGKIKWQEWEEESQGHMSLAQPQRASVRWRSLSLLHHTNSSLSYSRCVLYLHQRTLSAWKAIPPQMALH